jgi:hypothetical protein
MCPERRSGFFHRISEMNFDAPGIDAVICHWSWPSSVYGRGGIGAR